MIDDFVSWDFTHSDDLWIYDKLILSTKLGYNCGARGMTVPKAGKYVVRPIVNFWGMGKGAKFMRFRKYTDNIKDGHFWCEAFEGRHLSIDYYKGKQVLCVEGFRNNINNLSRWNLWQKTNDKIPFPKILKTLKRKYEWVNVEMIDGKIIEVHLRYNPDFMNHNSDYVIPVWKGMKTDPPEGCKFIAEEDGNRIGFFICSKN